MESRFKIPIYSIFLIASILLVSSVTADQEESKEFVVTLDHSNLTETISKHPFIVVEFYAPWCGHCKHLAPEYEQAASVLSTHEPSIVLAKFDASDEANKELASKYEIRGFPTLKIFRNGGENVQEYKGPREADGIVKYLKKQVGPASVEIKSVEEANNHITADAVFIVGIFPDFSGEEYKNFTILADKLRSDYDFGHTKDAKLLPRGDAVNEPLVRLFKPFDELVVDFQDFHVEALEKFIETASVPLVTLFNKDPSNQQYLMKFFNSANDKVMLFLNFSSDIFDSFKPAIHEVAEQYKGKGLSFLLGDVESSQNAFDYFGLKHSQVPVIVIQKEDGSKYLKPNLEPGHIASWLKEYNDGAVSPFIKSEPIPEVNDEPVKVVVADSLDDVVFKSGKNVLLEFYAPWCGHCKKLAPILEEIALSFQSDEDVIIAKFDATANDVPTKSFEVRGYPTLYFKKATGDVVKYDSGRTKEDIIEFIQKNRVKTVKDETVKEETTKDEL